MNIYTLVNTISFYYKKYQIFTIYLCYISKFKSILLVIVLDLLVYFL